MRNRWRELKRRADRWMFGPVPQDERADHLKAVLGERRSKRLITIGIAAVFLAWPLGPLYSWFADQDDPRRFWIAAAGSVLMLVTIYCIVRLRRALLTPRPPGEEPPLAAGR